MVRPTLFLERRGDGWVVALALPAEMAFIALEMLDDLVQGLSAPGDDPRVAETAGALVGLLDDLRIRSCLSAVTAALADA